MKPLCIGITGGMGAGKSTVASIFSVLGIPVYEADQRAKKLLWQNSSVKQQIVDLMGPSAYGADGRIDAAWVAAKLFADASLLKQYEAILHPATWADFAQWAQAQTTPYVLLESALIVKIGRYKHLDATLLVTAPMALRMQRLQKYRQLSPTQVEERLAHQLPDEAMRPFATYLIANNEETLLTPQVLHIHQAILASAQARHAI